MLELSTNIGLSFKYYFISVGRIVLGINFVLLYVYDVKVLSICFFDILNIRFFLVDWMLGLKLNMSKI